MTSKIQITKRVTVVVLFACIVSLSACGSSGGSSSTTTNGNSNNTNTNTNNTIKFKAHMVFSGPVDLGQDFTDSGSTATSCTVAAGGKGDENTGTWSVPLNQTGADPPTMVGLITHYTGPGTYSASDMTSETAATDLSYSFDPTSSSVITVTVNADGSGSASYTNLQDPNNPGNENANMTWTCSNG